ncbi:MAG: bacterial Ig-like domain-containing protein [Bacteroidales bacterium]|nr:bacterial Ig-like domain-containing protein [Bacteroidales bacterium]
MKRIASILAVAAAIIAFNSCERQEVEELKTIDHLTFTSAKPEVEDAVDTKTGWNGSSVQWLAGDKIRVGFTLDGVWQSSGKTLSSGPDTTPRFYATDPLKSDASNASFSLPIGESSFQEDFVNNLEGDIVFYGIYPSGACSAGQADAPSIVINIPAEQKPSASSFDASADILVGCSETLSEITADPVLMSWNRVVALADITLKGLNIPEGESLLRLTLTAQEGANLVGDYTVNVIDGSVSGNGENEISLNVSSLEITSDNTLEVWAGFLPETVTSLKVVLTTDVATYTKEISNIGLAFKKNKRNILGIKMGDAVREGKEVNKFALLETSNVTLNTGSNATDATVNDNIAIKVGTGKSGGDMTIVIPAGSTKLHLHAASWKGVSNNTLTITGASITPSTIDLKADDGISNNSPFTLNGSVDDFYYSFDLSGIDSEVPIKLSSDLRFAVWGVNVEPEPKVITWNLTGIEVTTTPNKTDYTVGQTFNPEGMVVTATYVDADDVANTKTAVIPNDELTYSPSLETALALTDEIVTISYEGKTDDVTISVAEPQEGEKTYTVVWNSTNNSEGVSSYTTTWSVNSDGIICEMANWNNNSNNWAYVKAGRKNYASVATITSSVIPEEIKTVTLTIDAVTASKINSLKLYVSSSADFTNYDSYSFSIGTGDQSVTIDSPKANCYYRIEVDCASGSSNGLITVSQLVFTTN